MELSLEDGAIDPAAVAAALLAEASNTSRTLFCGYMTLLRQTCPVQTVLLWPLLWHPTLKLECGAL
jgi:hypothetical protein